MQRPSMSFRICFSCSPPSVCKRSAFRAFRTHTDSFTHSTVWCHVNIVHKLDSFSLSIYPNSCLVEFREIMLPNSKITNAGVKAERKWYVPSTLSKIPFCRITSSAKVKRCTSAFPQRWTKNVTCLLWATKLCCLETPKIPKIPNRQGNKTL